MKVFENFSLLKFLLVILSIDCNKLTNKTHSKLEIYVKFLYDEFLEVPNGKVLLFCAANGIPLPTVNWMKLSNKNSDFYNVSDLILNLEDKSKNIIQNNVMKLYEIDVKNFYWTYLDHLGTNFYNIYKCKATNSFESVESTSLRVELKKIPYIRYQSNDTTTNLGINVYLTCEAIGYPLPSIQWKWISKNDKKFSEIPSNKVAKVLTTSHIERNDNVIWISSTIMLVNNEYERCHGYFQCIAVNRWGIYSSKTISISINFLLKNFIQDPANQVVFQSANITLTCISPSGYPIPNIRWYKNNNLIPYGSYKFQSTMIDDYVESVIFISNATTEDEAMYNCIASNSNGEVKSKSAYLTVLYPPTIDKLNIIGMNDVKETINNHSIVAFQKVILKLVKLSGY